MRATILIPARLESTRLSRKLLRDINGKSVLRRTIDRCLQVNDVRVVVLTDSNEILEHLNGCVECYITPSANNGTERIIKWINNIDDDIIVNVQGDEPFVSVRDLNRIIDILYQDKRYVITLDRSLYKEDLLDRSSVKLLKHIWGQVYCFTRSPIFTPNSILKKHIGIYGFTKETLLAISNLEQTQNSINESLEQITWAENGIMLNSLTTQEFYVSIDTEEDLKKAIAYGKNI